MRWTPNKVTGLRVSVGFAAVALFGHGSSANLAAVMLTVMSIILDALDGHLARKKAMATPLGAQTDILGDRMIENMFFTYFAVVGMVSLWLPLLFFSRGAATDFLRGVALKAGHSSWGANAMLETWWGRALVASRWSRGRSLDAGVRGLPVRDESDAPPAPGRAAARLANASVGEQPSASS
jgi:phosphatidylglycerophosphate synthase